MIRFEKWIDPFIPRDEPRPPRRDDDTNEARDSFLDGDGDIKTAARRRRRNGTFMVSPMGIFPVNDWNRPGNAFNLWVGHTDFLLTNHLVEKLEKTPGVEVLRVYTPYRFLLGIGHAFKTADVHEAIRQGVLPSKPDASNVAVNHLVESMKVKGGDWAVLVLKDGKLETVRALLGEVDFRQKIRDRKDAVRVITSWENKK